MHWFVIILRLLRRKSVVKIGLDKAEIEKKCDLKLLEILFVDLRWLFQSKLLKNITNFHFRPFVLICDHFEAS